jgi:uncharacterized membrane protein YcaP (DUF421 family)
MKQFYELIGEQQEKLEPHQMAIRAVLIFLIAVIMIRFSGRRSFGMRSAFDNVISILLGAVLSRSVYSSDPFFAPITASLVIAGLHRLFALISYYNDPFGCLIKGKARLIFEHGKFVRENMRRSLISEKDFIEGMRKENIEDISKVEKAYMERDGSISIIKKAEN